MLLKARKLARQGVSVLLILGGLVGVASCRPGGPPKGQPEVPEMTVIPAVSFVQDIQPIFGSRCVFCHQTGASQAGLNVGLGLAYKSLVKVPSTESRLLRVAPGDPENSYLLHKLLGTHLQVGGQGEQMPLGGPPLPKDDLEKIQKWIQDGAPEN
ncbi:MAG: hypothetical protein HY664_01255 [Chloroflexi bacterium]|nr:hypothetical protein [Chloroflexota bacterium]